jgi:hypothetical protein
MEAFEQRMYDSSVGSKLDAGKGPFPEVNDVSYQPDVIITWLRS